MSKKISFNPSLTTKSDYIKAWLDSLFIDHAIFRLVWSNFQSVIPNKIYRCNHPTPSRLRSLVEKYGIKTVINLRGQRHCGSDALSRKSCRELGITHIDLPFESRGAPHKDRILRLANLYPTLEFPILIHCKSGADRAGLVAGLITLFETQNIKQATRQLSWKFGHFKQSKTGILDAFFIQYYKETQNKIDFVHWVKNTYSEQDLRNRFKPKKFSTFITDKILRRE